MALVRDGEQEPGTPERLGNNVEDAKEEDLLVGRELASAFAEGKGDGVQGPDNNENEADLVVQAADLGSAKEGVAAAGRDKVPDDKEEGNAAEGEESPLARATRVEPRNDTSDDHSLVGQGKHDNLCNGEASEEGQVEKQERSGKGPVEVWKGRGNAISQV